MKTTTSRITPETTVADIVKAAPARSRIFEKLGIDFCCGGKQPLSEICAAKGLDPATVVAMLEALDEVSTTADCDPDTLGISELCDHIENSHHAYLLEELPRLDFMTRKVAAVHGEHEPRLVEIRRVFEAFQSNMATHTEEENREIFPAIRSVDASRDSASAAALKTKLEKLEHEHEGAGAALEEFKKLTDDYTPPDWACNTFRAMYDALDQLEKDMHLHVHKENNILFPKVLAVA